MPWSAKDAKAKTKKANSPVKQRQWAHVADSELASGKDEATAIRAANSVIKRRSGSSAKQKTGKLKSYTG